MGATLIDDKKVERTQPKKVGKEELYHIEMHIAKFTHYYINNPDKYYLTKLLLYKLVFLF